MKDPTVTLADEQKPTSLKPLRWIAFLSRVAFICNGFFLITALLQYKNVVQEVVAVSTIVVLGYFLSIFVFNPLVNFCYLVLLLRKQKLFDGVPRWLVMANFIFLILQVLYILFLHDIQHS
jgi:hypothetical protein